MATDDAPPADKWREYNDLVELTQLYWQLRPALPYQGGGREAWDRLQELIEGLIDLSARQRYWLQWILTADAAELDQWRNGEYAAAIANGMGLTEGRQRS